MLRQLSDEVSDADLLEISTQAFSWLTVDLFGMESYITMSVSAVAVNIGLKHKLLRVSSWNKYGRPKRRGVRFYLQR